MTKPSSKDPLKALLLAWAVLMTVLFAATQIEPRRAVAPDEGAILEPAGEARFVALPAAQEPGAAEPSDYQGYAAAPPPASTYDCAENGSCYGDLSQDTGRPKTVHVEGYFRSDGTYVRGHYRSSPR